ncbi:MAG: glycoside hydrolase family 25 protein [Niabella sp.]
MLLIFFILRWNESQRVKFIKYEAFGIEIPDGYDMHGIDVSRYQQSIGWKQVQEMNVGNISIDFAFIKATEGETLTDPYFKRNWKEAQKANVTRGVYHFFSPTGDAIKQAQFFIKQVKLQPGDLPPVLDIETIGTVPVLVLQAKAKIWLQMVESYYGVKPIIYTNADFYNKYLGEDFDEYPLWVAHYYEKHKPRINRNWNFWQHNDRGNVDGISAKVDFNVFNGDSLDFAHLLIK